MLSAVHSLCLQPMSSIFVDNPEPKTYHDSAPSDTSRTFGRRGRGGPRESGYDGRDGPTQRGEL
jgi:hypothetical protein